MRSRWTQVSAALSSGSLKNGQKGRSSGSLTMKNGVIGAAYAECLIDYFSRERHGHLGILVVSEAAQGRGVGQALLMCVESWGHEQGFRLLTLNVFFANEGARRFYERAAFSPDFVRYIKPLSRDP